MAGGAGNAPGADDAPNGAVALAEGAAAAAIPVGSPARSPVHAREPSLANWLRRVSSSALGGASEAAAATAAAPAALVASGAAEPSSSSGGGVGGWLRRLSSLRGGTDNGSAAAPAEAGAAGDGAPGGSEGDGSRPPSRPGSAASLHGSPFKAAAARERPGLPAVLDPSGEEAAAAAAAHAGAGAGDEPRGSDGGDAVLLSRASALALDGRGSAGVPLSLFPETPEGRLAQVRLRAGGPSSPCACPGWGNSQVVPQTKHVLAPPNKQSLVRCGRPPACRGSWYSLNCPCAA